MKSTAAGEPELLSNEEALHYASASPQQTQELVQRAGQLRDEAWGKCLTYSPKVFVPVTNLCRNNCTYCAFRRSPGQAGEWTMSPEQIEHTLVAARGQGCLEALLCLGDTPESAFPSYGATLAGLGHDSTVSYLVWASQRALAVGLFPHTNAGILSTAEMQRLKRVNVSLGLMIENVSDRLARPGMPHFRAPDKRPEARLKMLAEAGRLRIPFTTGILVGIGETRRERIEALLAIRDSHRESGHIQEVIVQNFTPHRNTGMSRAAPASDEDVAHAVALARLILPSAVSVQAPPNLNATRTALLVAAGINDFGGISPLTPDYINPDRPWPHVAALTDDLSALGFGLRPRLPIYDAFIDRPGFVEPALIGPLTRARQRLRKSVELGNSPSTHGALQLGSGAP